MGILNPNLKIEKPKEFNVSNTMLSEYSFYAMMLRQKQEELQMWLWKQGDVESRIKEQCGLKDTEEYSWQVDWGRIFSTGKIAAVKLLKPKIVPAKEEKK